MAGLLGGQGAGESGFLAKAGEFTRGATASRGSQREVDIEVEEEKSAVGAAHAAGSGAIAGSPGGWWGAAAGAIVGLGSYMLS